jgi:hypothetical protein
LILTSLNPSDQKIYTFEGPCAELIEKLTTVNFLEDDYKKVSNLIEGDFSSDEWKSLLKFCLEEKIFIQD